MQLLPSRGTLVQAWRPAHSPPPVSALLSFWDSVSSWVRGCWSASVCRSEQGSVSVEAEPGTGDLSPGTCPPPAGRLPGDIARTRNRNRQHPGVGHHFGCRRHTAGWLRSHGDRSVADHRQPVGGRWPPPKARPGIDPGPPGRIEQVAAPIQPRSCGVPGPAPRESTRLLPKPAPQRAGPVRSARDRSAHSGQRGG